MVNIQRLVRHGLRAYRMYQRYAGSKASRGQSPTTARGGWREGAAPSQRPGAGASGGSGGSGLPYLGDWTGPVNPRWAPHPDGRPDPGEVVWTWVPYEEDHSRGKDRPVLIVDRAGDYLLCVMLTSKDHDTAGFDHPDFVEIGPGDWDRSARPSEARIDRIIPVRPEDVRREGAVLDQPRFDAVARALSDRR